MIVSEREIDVLKLVHQFGLMTGRQATELVFHGNASRTPADRTLRRMTDNRLLYVLGRRPLLRDQPGHGSYVYQLGSEGVRALGEPGPWRRRGSTEIGHTVDIVDAYVRLMRAERDDRLTIREFTTEPATRLSVHGVVVEPDLHVVVRPVLGHDTHFWFEVDKSSEWKTALLGKFEKYWTIFNNVSSSQLPVFPLVVFITEDEARQRYIGNLRAGLTGKLELEDGVTVHQRELFRVERMDSFVDAILT